MTSPYVPFLDIPSNSDPQKAETALLDKRLDIINRLLDDPLWLPHMSRDAYHEVLPGIYLGNFFSTLDPQLMSKVGAVLSILNPLTIPRPMTRSQMTDKHWHLYIPLDDRPYADISQHFDKAYQFIEDARRDGRSVLIHCAAGISRSTTLLTYYIMKKYNVDLPTALYMLKKHRSIIRPNSGFLEQLAEAEMELEEKRDIHKVAKNAKKTTIKYLD